MSNENEENESSEGETIVQNFLDRISTLELSQRQKDWYLIDVLAIIDGYTVEHFEVDELGDSLIFLKSSLLFCSPELGVIRHYPKSLIHCFVEDRRVKIDEKTTLLFRGELFSVTPESEQLSWLRDALEAHQIPEVQWAIGKWMKWLNQ
tara:strand:- start:138 stop:584 length:447 start_codon:yes stop_codon:yes gene_type:complete